MLRAGSTCFLILLLGIALCAADSITIDGKRYENVEIRESATRYYVRIPSENKTISVSKDQVAPGDIEYSGPRRAEEAPAEREPEPEPKSDMEGNALNAGASTVLVPQEQSSGDQLEINALVLQADENTLAFCAVDTAALNQALLKRVGDRLMDKRSALRRYNVMLAATHTYAGAFAGLMKGPLAEFAFGDFDRGALDEAVGLIAKAILEAEQGLQPAQIRFTESAAPQYVRNRTREDGVVDPRLGALYVETSDGKPIAYLVNYACQPVITPQARAASERSRDFPGGIAEALREAAGAPVPVVFINGAEANAAPQPPAGDTPAQQARAMGNALGQIAIEVLAQARPVPIKSIESRTRAVDLPESLLGELAPRSTVLQDFAVGPAVFLSLPGEAGSQIGLALREKAISRGAKHVFLCGLTGDYTWYHTDATEFFGPSEASRRSFFGPLMIHWYLANHLPGIEGAPPPPPWRCSTLLGKHRGAYFAGLSKGKQEKDLIFVAWNNVSESIRTMANMIRAAGGLSEEVEELAARVPQSDAVKLAVQFAAVFAREQSQDLTDEQRARLMGVAEGAKLPVDAIILLQFLVNPVGVPEGAAQLFAAIQFTSMDFLAD